MFSKVRGMFSCPIDEPSFPFVRAGTHKLLSSFLPCLRSFVLYCVALLGCDQIEVNGPGSHPIYKFLKGSNEAAGTAEIDWNFHKILVGRDGKVVQRYAAATEPSALEKDIENILG